FTPGAATAPAGRHLVRGLGGVHFGASHDDLCGGLVVPRRATLAGAGLEQARDAAGHDERGVVAIADDARREPLPPRDAGLAGGDLEEKARRFLGERGTVDRAVDGGEHVGHHAASPSPSRRPTGVTLATRRW